MLNLVQNWFKAGANAIGIDMGSDALRMAQVERVNGEYALVAAASATLPVEIARGDWAARMDFFATNARRLLTEGNFRGRRAVLALPASIMAIAHLRMARIDDAELKKALPWEAAGKLPFDPSQALLRHLVAGEVYQDQEPKNEIILMAARREQVNLYLAAAARAKIDVVGMNVEPTAIIDCFSKIYRRKSDAETTCCFLDIGHVGTRVVIAQVGEIRFARMIPIGGERFSSAVASQLNITADEARQARAKQVATEEADIELSSDASRDARSADTPAPQAEDHSFALLSAGLAASNAGGVATATLTPRAPARTASTQRDAVRAATRPVLRKLVEELDLCRRYYESAFPNRPIDQLVFVGGEAANRPLCQEIAKELGLAAQVGDPLVRMGRTTQVGPESGLDRRQPQPGWSVAIGLSMGRSAEQS